MRRCTAWLTGVLLLAGPGRAGAQADSAQSRPFSFAVLGHIRGDATGALNPKLGELLDQLRVLRPDFVVLTGDIINGDLVSSPPDTQKVRRQWEAVDSALATLGRPVYRVPGNHDISDLGTKRIWWQRYGSLPRVMHRYGARFILLASAWIPADDDTVRQIVTRPVGLDSAQSAWLRDELANRKAEPTFVLMHHLLWWNADAPWWKEIHPLLHPAGVQVVFGGDLGPLKFSQMIRDSVQYVQGSLEGFPSLEMLQSLESSRILSAQFDNFLLVQVNGTRVDLRVKTLGEFSSPVFTPPFYQAMMNPPRRSPWLQAREVLGLRRVVGVLGSLGLVGLVTGWLLARRAALRSNRRERP